MPRISKECFGGFEEFQGLTIDPNLFFSFSKFLRLPSAQSSALQAERAHPLGCVWIFHDHQRSINSEFRNRRPLRFGRTGKAIVGTRKRPPVGQPSGVLDVEGRRLSRHKPREGLAQDWPLRRQHIVRLSLSKLSKFDLSDGF